MSSNYAKYGGLGGGGGSGTVTSVGLADGSTVPLYAISGSPVTTTGTLTFTLNNEPSNTVLAGPTSGGSAQPTFRSLVTADLPVGTGTVTSVALAAPALFTVSGSPVTTSGTLTLSYSGTALPVANGGTSLTTLTANNVILGNGTSAPNFVAPGSSGNVLTSNGTTWTSSSNPGTNAITALTGDVTATGPGSVPATLATVNANVGSFGSSTSIPNFTVNAKGLITAAGGNVVIAPAGTLTGTTLASNVLTSSLTSLGIQSQALNMGSHLINAVTDPVSAQDAATKNYVDTVASGLQPIQGVQAATPGSNISGTYSNGVAGVGATFTTTSLATFVVDGFTFTTLGQRVLLKDQTSGFQNGVYSVTQLATGILPTILTRTLDYDTASDMNAGTLVPVINGTVNALTSWLQTATITTVGTDSLVFVEWTANPANYLLKANNLSDVASKTTSFDNLSPMTTLGDTIYGGASGTGTRLAIGSTGQVYTVVGGIPSWQTPTGTSIAIFSNQQGSSVGGGNCTAGTWNQTPLNTTDLSQSWASLSSNQITLSAGTYYFNVTSPVFGVGLYQTSIFDTTNSIRYLGQSGYSNPSLVADSSSFISAQATIVGSTIYEVDMYPDTSQTGFGFGIPNTIGTNVYCRITVTKLA